MPRPPVMYVKSPKQWELLLSPVRGEIAQALRCIGPCSAAELAKMIDRPADTLYRHLDALRRAGFVVEAGERRKARHHERLFDVAADDFAMEFSSVFPREGDAVIRRTSRAFLGAIGKSVDDSLRAGELRIADSERNFILNYELSWLTPAKFKKARSLMYQVKQLMDDSRTQAQGRLHCSLTVLCPVTRTKRRSAKSG